MLHDTRRKSNVFNRLYSPLYLPSVRIARRSRGVSMLICTRSLSASVPRVGTLCTARERGVRLNPCTPLYLHPARTPLTQRLAPSAQAAAPPLAGEDILRQSTSHRQATAMRLVLRRS